VVISGAPTAINEEVYPSAPGTSIATTVPGEIEGASDVPGDGVSVIS
jgi:hypothetical protein